MNIGGRKISICSEITSRKWPVNLYMNLPDMINKARLDLLYSFYFRDFIGSTEIYRVCVEINIQIYFWLQYLFQITHIYTYDKVIMDNCADILRNNIQWEPEFVGQRTFFILHISLIVYKLSTTRNSFPPPYWNELFFQIVFNSFSKSFRWR